MLCAENLIQMEIESPYKYAKRPFEPNISEPSDSNSSSSMSNSTDSLDDKPLVKKTKKQLLKMLTRGQSTKNIEVQTLAVQGDGPLTPGKRRGTQMFSKLSKQSTSVNQSKNKKQKSKSKSKANRASIMSKAK